jgi:hypothetical protein
VTTEWEGKGERDALPAFVQDLVAQPREYCLAMLADAARALHDSPVPVDERAAGIEDYFRTHLPDFLPTFHLQGSDLSDLLLSLIDDVSRDVPGTGASKPELLRWGHTVRAGLRTRLAARGVTYHDLFGPMVAPNIPWAMPWAGPWDWRRDPLPAFPLAVAVLFDLAAALALSAGTFYGGLELIVAALRSSVVETGADRERGGQVDSVLNLEQLEEALIAGFARQGISRKKEVNPELHWKLELRHGEKMESVRDDELPGATYLAAREVIEGGLPSTREELRGLVRHLRTRVTAEVEQAQSVDGHRGRNVPSHTREHLEFKAHGGDPTSEVALRRFAAAEELQNLLQVTSDLERQVLELRLADLDFGAIADELGITEGAAKVRAHRGMKKMRSSAMSGPV